MASGSLLLTADAAAFRSGLYIFANANATSSPGLILYLIYWPEKSTWDGSADEAGCRNRQAFIHRLTQLTTQIRLLVAREDEASIVWDGHSADLSGGILEQELVFNDTTWVWQKVERSARHNPLLDCWSEV